MLLHILLWKKFNGQVTIDTRKRYLIIYITVVKSESEPTIASELNLLETVAKETKGQV